MFPIVQNTIMMHWKNFIIFSPIPILIGQAPFHCHHLFDGIVLFLLNKLNTLNHQCDFTTELQIIKINKLNNPSRSPAHRNLRTRSGVLPAPGFTLTPLILPHTSSPPVLTSMCN